MLVKINSARIAYICAILRVDGDMAIVSQDLPGWRFDVG